MSSVIQVANISTQATQEQIITLFSFIGAIEDFKIFATDFQSHLSSETDSSQVCYIKYKDQTSGHVAQHLSNTILLEKPLEVMLCNENTIPDKLNLEIISNNITPDIPEPVSPDLPLPPSSSWPIHVVHKITGGGSTQLINTIDPKLSALGLPQYPPLTGVIEPTKVEEIRRTIYVGNLNSKVTGEALLNFFNQIGEVKYVRMAGDDSQPTRFAFVEFSHQESIPSALQYNGVLLADKPLKINHANNAIVKPNSKPPEVVQKEIERAMNKVKEVESMISSVLEADGEKGRRKERDDRSHERKKDRHRSKERSRRRSRSRDSRERSSKHGRRRSRSRSLRRKRESDRRRSDSRDGGKGGGRRSHGRRSSKHKRSRSKEDRKTAKKGDGRDRSEDRSRAHRDRDRRSHKSDAHKEEHSKDRGKEGGKSNKDKRRERSRSNGDKKKSSTKPKDSSTTHKSGDKGSDKGREKNAEDSGTKRKKDSSKDAHTPPSSKDHHHHRGSRGDEKIKENGRSHGRGRDDESRHEGKSRREDEKKDRRRASSKLKGGEISGTEKVRNGDKGSKDTSRRRDRSDKVSKGAADQVIEILDDEPEKVTKNRGEVVEFENGKTDASVGSGSDHPTLSPRRASSEVRTVVSITEADGAGDEQEWVESEVTTSKSPPPIAPHQGLAESSAPDYVAQNMDEFSQEYTRSPPNSPTQQATEMERSESPSISPASHSNNPISPQSQDRHQRSEKKSHLDEELQKKLEELEREEEKELSKSYRQYSTFPEQNSGGDVLTEASTGELELPPQEDTSSLASSGDGDNGDLGESNTGGERFEGDDGGHHSPLRSRPLPIDDAEGISSVVQGLDSPSIHSTRDDYEGGGINDPTTTTDPRHSSHVTQSPAIEISSYPEEGENFVVAEVEEEERSELKDVGDEYNTLLKLDHNGPEIESSGGISPVPPTSILPLSSGDENLGTSTRRSKRLRSTTTKEKSPPSHENSPTKATSPVKKAKRRSTKR